ncbi:hypothetical protein DFJ63DRAFT_336060 [Scheffersomyces coipomensis]|uniref:uncharacterized protein n=1 Tax=Scheffersomyces coipomensis TaxID=1788519 RepID=UPI00315D1C66
MSREENTEKLETLHQSLLDSINTYKTAQDLLSTNQQLINQSNTNEEIANQLQTLKKQFILDSFNVNKVIKDYKDWDHQYTQDFINYEIFNYNKVLTDNNRLQQEVDKLTGIYEELYNKVSLPDIEFSIQTLIQFNDEEILRQLPRDENGSYPKIIHINQLFSLDPKSELSFPDYKKFQKLTDIEYRLRASKRLKYEILLFIKNQVSVNNTKWSKRDNELKTFLNQKLPKVFDEVNVIKGLEAKALKVNGGVSNGDEEGKSPSDDEDDEDEIIQQDFDEDEDEEDHRDDDGEHENGSKVEEEEEEEEEEEDVDVDIEGGDDLPESRQETVELEDTLAPSQISSTKPSDIDSDGDELLI